MTSVTAPCTEGGRLDVLRVEMPGDQSATLRSPQRVRQHLVGDPLHTVVEVLVATAAGVEFGRDRKAQRLTSNSMSCRERRRSALICGAVLLARCWCRFAFDVHGRQDAVEPRRKPPVPPAEEVHEGGHEDGADDEGVDDDGDGETYADFLDGQ